MKFDKVLVGKAIENWVSYNKKSFSGEIDDDELAIDALKLRLKYSKTKLIKLSTLEVRHLEEYIDRLMKNESEPLPYEPKKYTWGEELKFCWEQDPCATIFLSFMLLVMIGILSIPIILLAKHYPVATITPILLFMAYKMS